MGPERSNKRARRSYLKIRGPLLFLKQVSLEHFVSNDAQDLGLPTAD